MDENRKLGEIHPEPKGAGILSQKDDKNIRLKKCVVKIELIEDEETSKIYLPKNAFGVGDNYNFVAIKKENDGMIKLFPYLNTQRLFGVYAEIKEGQLDKFYQEIVRFVSDTEGLNLTGMDGICTKECAFDGCLVVDGLAEVVMDDLRNKLEALGIVKKLEIAEVK